MIVHKKTPNQSFEAESVWAFCPVAGWSGSWAARFLWTAKLAAEALFLFEFELVIGAVKPAVPNDQASIQASNDYFS